MKTVNIKSIHIKELFEIFDYDVRYPEDENVLIIAGPNGFGKTQILNMLFSLFSRKFYFFYTLSFKEIRVFLSNDTSIKISKDTHNDQTTAAFSFFEGDERIEKFTYELNVSLLEHIRISPVPEWAISEDDEDEWFDDRTGEIISLNEVFSRYADLMPEKIDELDFKTEKANATLDSIDVHLIREQRLLKKIDIKEPSYRRGKKDQTIMTETVRTYSEELRELISKSGKKSYAISQDLDGSYPKRLISEVNRVSKEEYNRRFAELKEKQNKLMKHGLYQKTQEALEYSRDDAKALLVYLNDLEKKLDVFDALLEKLELFTNILNERRFIFKSISINSEKGFVFKTTKGRELKLSQLSSGEQHEVALLYELIFKTQPGILVLIDEPEISLHITWQKEFINDLLKIIEIQNFQALIATHAPAIINDRWDLAHTLKSPEND